MPLIDPRGRDGLGRGLYRDRLANRATVWEHNPATSNKYRQDVAHRRPPTGLVIRVRPGTVREHNPATGNATERVACRKPPSGRAVLVKKGAIRGHSPVKASAHKWVNASVCIGACRRLRGA
ncbi:hypothetical protein V6N13_124864 [Hibiscus sabdariffa]